MTANREQRPGQVPPAQALDLQLGATATVRETDSRAAPQRLVK